MTHPTFRIAICSSLLVLGAGCAAKNTGAVSAGAKETARATPAARPSTPPASAELGAADQEEDPGAAPIYYELDSAQLKEESRQMLQRLAGYLRRHPSATVEVDGHTCDLGTSEYNLALGMKRAGAARDYLVTLGVAASQVSTVSFGEERPADSAETDGARSKNRRSEFSIRLAQATSSR